jgi:hypothetical protein
VTRIALGVALGLVIASLLGWAVVAIIAARDNPDWPSGPTLRPTDPGMTAPTTAPPGG